MPGIALQFIQRNAQLVIKVAQPAVLGDLVYAGHIRVVHGLRPPIALGNEGEIGAELLAALREAGLTGLRLGLAGPDEAAQALNVRIAQQDFKAHTDFVNAVVQGLQLGSLVDHMFGRRDLAAVVQPGPNAKLMPLVF